MSGTDRAPNLGGRPTKWTPEIQERMCAARRKGLSREHCCALVEIVPNTLVYWEKQGEAGVEPYAGFCRAFERASAELAESCLDTLDHARNGTLPKGAEWTPAGWKLERIFQKTYGRQQLDVTHSGAVGIVTIDGIEKMTSEQIRAALGLEDE